MCNGNWHDGGKIQHVCAGCCSNREHSVQRLSRCLEMMCTSLRQRMFSRSNWLGWSGSMNFFLFGIACHQFLPAAFELAFARPPQTLGAAPLAAAGGAEEILVGDADHSMSEPVQAVDFAVHGHEPEDEMARMRKELALSNRAALQWLRSPDLLHELLMLRLSLEPERALMIAMLRQESKEMELHNLHRMSTADTRAYRLYQIYLGTDFQEFIRSSAQICCEDSPWRCAPEMDSMRTDVLRVSMRSASHRLPAALAAIPAIPICLPGTHERRGPRRHCRAHPRHSQVQAGPLQHPALASLS